MTSVWITNAYLLSAKILNFQLFFDASLLRDGSLTPCLFKQHAQSNSLHHEVIFMMFYCKYPVRSDTRKTFHRTQRAITNARNIP